MNKNKEILFMPMRFRLIRCCCFDELNNARSVCCFLFANKIQTLKLFLK